MLLQYYEESYDIGMQQCKLVVASRLISSVIRRRGEQAYGAWTIIVFSTINCARCARRMQDVVDSVDFVLQKAKRWQLVCELLHASNSEGQCLQVHSWINIEPTANHFYTMLSNNLFIF